MDPLTQGLLGASVGGACYGQALGRRALAWGALVGMAPARRALGRAGSGSTRRGAPPGPASGSTACSPRASLSSSVSFGVKRSERPDRPFAQRSFYVPCVPVLPFDVRALTVK
jgi:hypothetical protein